MSHEYTESYEYDAPRGWGALSPCRSTAELWGQYSAEITAENEELRDALEELLRALGPTALLPRQELKDPVLHATMVLHKAKKRQRQRDRNGGEQ